MSTTSRNGMPPNEAALRADQLRLVSSLEADRRLYLDNQLRKRLRALDFLDAAFGDLDIDYPFVSLCSSLRERARSLRMRLEAANLEAYEFLRTEIVRCGQPCTLLQWLDWRTKAGQVRRCTPGFGYDYRDELVSGVFRLLEPTTPDFLTSPEMVPYQPTPVRHILNLIEAAAITEKDVLVDLGSGLGHVPLLVSLVTGARSLGIELQAAYVASAQRCAMDLSLSRVRYVAQDARKADLARGTVFYLYSPFTGSILTDVLFALRSESSTRPIKICSLGPCTYRISAEKWLKASTRCEAESVAIFESL